MKQYSILVVDDQPENLKIIINYLKESDSNYQILLAPNGKIAFEIAKKKIPDLIVTDWDMPEMNGIELIKHLKEIEKTKDIPVIVASGVMTLPGNVKTALETGAIDYIKKPVEKIELIARVNSMLKLSVSYKKIKEQNQQLELQKEKIETFVKELEIANNTKDKFFSIIAHDLSSPFNAIIGFSELLLENHKKYNDEDRKEMIKFINTGSKTAFKLLETLFTWARSQSGEIQYLPEELNLKIIVSYAITENEVPANRKEIQLINNITGNEIIFADKNMLDTILRNLISNAIKFTPRKGKVFVSSKKQKDEGFIEISVNDTGVGMPQDQIDNIFRIDKNTITFGTEGEKGTGLGLILCKEFVEKHGGEIRIESNATNGSSLIFTMPLNTNQIQ